MHKPRLTCTYFLKIKKGSAHNPTLFEKIFKHEISFIQNFRKNAENTCIQMLIKKYPLMWGGGGGGQKFNVFSENTYF